MTGLPAPDSSCTEENRAEEQVGISVIEKTLPNLERDPRKKKEKNEAHSLLTAWPPSVIWRPFWLHSCCLRLWLRDL